MRRVIGMFSALGLALVGLGAVSAPVAAKDKQHGLRAPDQRLPPQVLDA